MVLFRSSLNVIFCIVDPVIAAVAADQEFGACLSILSEIGEIIGCSRTAIINQLALRGANGLFVFLCCRT